MNPLEALANSIVACRIIGTALRQTVVLLKHSWFAKFLIAEARTASFAGTTHFEIVVSGHDRGSRLQVGEKQRFIAKLEANMIGATRGTIEPKGSSNDVCEEKSLKPQALFCSSVVKRSHDSRVWNSWRANLLRRENMMKKMICSMLGAGVITGAAHAGTFLLDYGSPGPYNSGRTIAGTNAAGGFGFTTFQSFTVTDAAGWNISTIGVDGWNVVDPNNSGFTGTILAVDGNGDPDENTNLGSGQYFLQTTAGQSNWVDVAFNVVLPQGDYFMRFDSFGDADLHSAVFLGDAGGPGSLLVVNRTVPFSMQALLQSASMA